MSRLADGGYCKTVADRLGMSQIAVEEAFLGEPVEDCNHIVRWIEQTEVEMRATRGWHYTVRHFKASRMLQAWAKKYKRGAFRDGT